MPYGHGGRLINRQARKKRDRKKTSRSAIARAEKRRNEILGAGPLTEEQAQAAYDAAVPVPLSEKRIQEIVEYATRPHQ